MTVATAAMQPRRLQALEALGEVLLGWGALSSLLYAAADVLAASRYEGYRFASQAIGELSAIGAPTRPLAVSLGVAYAVLVVGFGIAVWEAARGARAVRLTGALAVACALAGLAALLFPMHARGAPRSLADAVHLALTAATVLLVLLQLAVGSGVAGAAFRRYSLATFAVVALAAALAAWMRLAPGAGVETPGLGIAERLCAGGYLLWIAVLDFVLLGAEKRAFAARLVAMARARP